ncbi:MAG: hypothetical protein ACD_2C00211G0002 [uncultured bacterium (gcode 4)]|uniref:Uncharacterized protein n=1 Tax=uncultured bacterium (gcode 4) TaxID=1234023 RepID=K2G1W3_9BACT|nr:MAG: hypothetical protein ACD_2C00211G0002 [uncultured bacterium (gcode 4)]
MEDVTIYHPHMDKRVCNYFEFSIQSEKLHQFWNRNTNVFDFRAYPWEIPDIIIMNEEIVTFILAQNRHDFHHMWPHPFWWARIDAPIAAFGMPFEIEDLVLRTKMWIRWMLGKKENWIWILDDRF